MTRMTVNGRPVEFALDPATPLLFAMRDAMNVTSAKHGCDDGSCHACTMLVDGQPARSCTLPIRDLEGAVVTSVEGLPASDGLPAAWEETQATMCGFCDPGFRLAFFAILQTNAAPDEATLAAIPNRCPCGNGPRLAQALQAAAAALRRSSEPDGRRSDEFSLGSDNLVQAEDNRPSIE